MIIFAFCFKYLKHRNYLLFRKLNIVHPRYIGLTIPLAADWTIENKGILGYMYIYHIAKHFTCLYHILILYDFVAQHISKCNKEIVGSNTKVDKYNCVVLFIACVLVLQFTQILSKYFLSYKSEFKEVFQSRLLSVLRTFWNPSACWFS